VLIYGVVRVQPCYDTCTSIVRYSIILGLNTLIGWRAYFNTRQAVGGSGERGVLEDRFARKIPLSRQPRPRGHQSASFSPSVLHARTHGHDDKPWPAGLRGTSKYFEKVIVDGKHRSTCASSAVVAPGQPFRFSGNIGQQEDGADSSPLVHLPSAAHCSRRLE
jgi:hypothetical protein